jgi:hypothetical protein
LFVVSVKSEASVVGVLNQVAVKVVNITLPGAETIRIRVDGGMRQIVNRQLAAADYLTECRPIAETVVTERLSPVLRAAGRFSGFRQTIQLVIFISLDEAGGRQRYRLPGNAPDTFGRVDGRSVRVQFAVFVIYLPETRLRTCKRTADIRIAGTAAVRLRAR